MDGPPVSAVKHVDNATTAVGSESLDAVFFIQPGQHPAAVQQLYPAVALPPMYNGAPNPNAEYIHYGADGLPPANDLYEPALYAVPPPTYNEVMRVK